MTWPSPPFPSPHSLRLLGASGARPPFGLARFGDDGDIALALSSALDLSDVVRQLPPCEALPAGALVVVLGELVEAQRPLSRWLRATMGGPSKAPRLLRTSALLARGYERIGGGTDPKTGQDLAWGYVSSLPSPAP